MPGQFKWPRRPAEEPDIQTPALPDAPVVSEFPEAAQSPEEATRPTGKAVIVLADGMPGDIYLYRVGEDSYVFGDETGPDTRAHGGVSSAQIVSIGHSYKDRGWRPVR